MFRKLLVGFALASMLAAPSATVSATEKQLTYNLTSFTRAYAYKISVTKEAIEASRAQSTLYEQCKAQFNHPECEQMRPCNPDTDKYACDASQYDHAPNCLGAAKLGTEKQGPQPVLPDGAIVISGGAGQGAGVADNDADPPGASPVKINELVTTGSLGKTPAFGGFTLLASGSSSDTFVDLDGTANQEAHTDTDAFVPNKSAYEERCDPNEGGSYVHVLSRSKQAPSTYNIAQCFGNRCSESGSLFGRPAANHARTIVSLFEEGGKVKGKLFANVSGGDLGGGLTIESATTYISFETDGTSQGLNWSVATVASGVKLFGVPIATPPGETIGLPGGTFVGVAGPYVKSAQDGTSLAVIAPGFFYGTEQQTTYIAGAELFAGMGRADPFVNPVRPPDDLFDIFIPGFTDGPGGQFPIGGPLAAPTGPEIGPGDSALALDVREVVSGPWAIAAILAFGLIAMILVLGKWVQRFDWGRRWFEAQPLRSINWMFRAFIQT